MHLLVLCVGLATRPFRQLRHIPVHYSYLNETNILALLPEALTADAKVVFADETGLVLADTATKTC